MPTATTTSRKLSRRGERLEARLTRTQKRLIARAAQLRGTTVTEFVIDSAQRAAAEEIRASESMQLDAQASLAFAKALLDPAPPNAALRAAIQRHKKLVRH